MDKETCGIIACRQQDIVGYRSDNYLAECIRPRGHYPPHLLRTPEGRYYAWEDDECDCCEPEDPDRCHVFWEIGKEETTGLIKRK